MENSRLSDSLKEIGIELSELQERQFSIYYDTLIEWNAYMNLTAITAYEDVVIKHFTDSLSLVCACDVGQASALLDVGTGAGFPGIPLKIVFPDLKVTLLDSLNKRVGFLNEVIQRLDLENIRAVHGRAEELGRREEYREQYDLCVSRAVADLRTLAEYCIPFVKKGGLFAAYKSGLAGQELENAKPAISLLGGRLRSTKSFALPGTDMERMLIIIEKLKNTPPVYPRGGGRPVKEPL